MKYGLELQENIFPPWRLSYVAYDVLKQELKSRQLDHGWTQQDEADFVHLLDNELTKVYDFINAKLSEIDARILYCERTIHTLHNNPTMQTDASYKIMDEALTEILFDVNDLSKFTRVNYMAIQKMLKKHDRWTGLDLKQAFVQKLRDKPLDNQRFDVSIVYISALHALCRSRGNRQASSSDNKTGINADGDQNAFERATAKYWIHPDNVTEVKAIIMLHLPVLIFNRDKKWEVEDSAISSVYMDNDNFDLYAGRLQRDEGAEAIRLRWYGPYDTKSVFVERKTHHASWLQGASVKDRFRLSEPDVNPFLRGDYSADQIANDLRAKKVDEPTVDNVHFIASGVQTSVREKELRPTLRAFYNRTAFQLPDDQKLRISLDTNLTFIREDHLDSTSRRPKDNWRRPDVRIDYPFSYLPDSEILRFPYAVLETKLQTHLGQEPPAWLSSLIESHLVHEVPRFSKYLHGACHFYRERLALLPWWLSEMNQDIRKPRAENIGLTRSKSFKPLIDGRYRRAMIEEKERANQDAVMRSGQPGITLEDATPNSREGSPGALSSSETLTKSRTPERRRLIDDDSETPESWKPVQNTQQQHLTVDMKPGNTTALGTPVMVQSQSSSSVNRASGNNNKKKSGPMAFLNWNNMIEEGESNKRQKVKVRVEPKVFFANERTFISWLQFCALLLTVALSLLNFGDNSARIVGGIFIGLAAVVAIYALYRFEKRAWMINRRVDGRYDDLWGPAVLCTLLVGALIVNFYLRFH
ncbi:VTC domain-containing protein [Zychaea mexicana]|uniref:VTC domain-containing protein n=1 Tax=Zychaea mexicana TaxID=64656 RepID=UPI0022FF1968|nr:VTC domain-containing protein [Zychaea mexicana]KAI9493343.1 VTC domain-containing protein [Zychaea mexicana]